MPECPDSPSSVTLYQLVVSFLDRIPDNDTETDFPESVFLKNIFKRCQYISAKNNTALRSRTPKVNDVDPAYIVLHPIYRITDISENSCSQYGNKIMTVPCIFWDLKSLPRSTILLKIIKRIKSYIVMKLYKFLFVFFCIVKQVVIPADFRYFGKDSRT